MRLSEFRRPEESWREACNRASDMGYRLDKYADPEEGPLSDMHPYYAAQVAAEDSSLVHLVPFRPREVTHG